MKNHTLRIDEFDEDVVRFYRIRSVDVNKVGFDVFAVEDCKTHNDFESNRVITLNEPAGTVKLMASQAIIFLAVNAVGCIVYNLNIDVNGKKAMLTNMDFAKEEQINETGGE